MSESTQRIHLRYHTLATEVSLRPWALFNTILLYNQHGLYWKETSLRTSTKKVIMGGQMNSSFYAAMFLQVNIAGMPVLVMRYVDDLYLAISVSIVMQWRHRNQYIAICTRLWFDQSTRHADRRLLSWGVVLSLWAHTIQQYLDRDMVCVLWCVVVLVYVTVTNHPAGTTHCLLRRYGVVTRQILW